MLSPDDLQRLSDYLDDALSGSERAALETRLQADAELSHELARLRATVELVGTLPTLPAPRSFALTPRMARRPSVLTSPAFSMMSAAAAVVLLVVGAALFSIRPPAAAPTANQVAFAPTTPVTAEFALRDTNVPEQGGNAAETMELKSETEISAGSVAVSIPTSSPMPTFAPQLNAAVSTQSPGSAPPADVVPSALATNAAPELYAAAPSVAADQAAESQADSAVAQTDDQLRYAAEEPSSAAASGAAAQAPLPAPTLLPPGTATLAPAIGSLDETAAEAPTSSAAATLTETQIPTRTAANTAAPASTSVPMRDAVPNPGNDGAQYLGVVAIIAALMLFAVAIVTTLRRRA